MPRRLLRHRYTGHAGEARARLLSEHEVTRLITLVTAIAKKMGVEESRDPELKELAQDVAPENVLDKMDDTERKLRRPKDA